MSQEEWQDTLSDAAKTDDNDPPREIDVYLVIQFILLLVLGRNCSGPPRPDNFGGHCFVARRQKGGASHRGLRPFCRLRFVLIVTTAASAAEKCDRNREVPPRAAPIDRARDNSLRLAETGMPTHGPRDAPAPAAATETRER